MPGQRGSLAVVGRRAGAVLAGFLLCFPASAKPPSDGMALVPLSVNTVDKDIAAVIIETNDVLVAVSDLDHAGVVKYAGTRRTVAGTEYVSLASLAPAVSFRLDPQDLSLHLQVDATLLSGSESRNLRSGRPPGLVFSTNPSAFLNYSASADSSGNLSGFAEAGWSLQGDLLYSSVSRNADGSLVRGLTNLTVDDPARMVRWVAGDSLAVGGPLGGGPFIAGISMSKNFGLDPYFYRFPSMDVAGAVATPTRADVYVNGQLVREVQLAPGTFDLNNIGLQTGLGEARVVLRDAFGQERVISNPYYISSSQLGRGVSEYSYNLGFLRENVATESFDYGDPVFVGLYRLGLSDSVTAGLSAEATRGVANAGATVAAVLRPFEIEASGAQSRGGRDSGWAASAALSTVTRGFTVGGFWQARSDRYATVSLPAIADRPIQEVGGSVTVGIGRLGTIGVQYSWEKYRDAGLTSTYGATLNSPLGRRFSLLTTVDRKRTSGTLAGVEASVRLSVYLGGLTAASVAASHDDAGTHESFNEQKSVGPGVGYGYRLQGETGGASSNQVTAFGEYQGPYGHYEAEYDQFGGADSGHVTVSGGIVAIGGEVMASRAVEDAFGLLRVAGIEGIAGSVSNQTIGKTNSRGDLVLPELIPFYGNVVTIDQDQVPIDVDVESFQRIVGPPYRGGALIEFAAHKILAFRGSVKVSFRGREVVPAYGAITVTVGGKAFETSISKNGGYYLENVPPGAHPAEIVYMGVVCSTTITFPQTLESVSRIPEVVCAVDAPAPAGAVVVVAPPTVSGLSVAATQVPVPTATAPEPIPVRTPTAAPSPAAAPSQMPGPSAATALAAAIPWGVEVATYRDRAKAEAEAARLAAALGTVGTVREARLGPSDVWYRVVLGRFATQEGARRFKAEADSKIPGGAGAVVRVDAKPQEEP